MRSLRPHDDVQPSACGLSLVSGSAGWMSSFAPPSAELLQHSLSLSLKTHTHTDAGEKSANAGGNTHKKRHRAAEIRTADN